MNLTTEKASVVMMGAISIAQSKDPYWWVGTIIVVFAAYSLRIMGDISNKNFTWTSAIVQLITTVALCSVGYYVWKDAAPIRELWFFFGSFQIFIFFVAYFSFIIVSIGHKIDADGIISVGNWLNAVRAAISANKNKNNNLPKP